VTLIWADEEFSMEERRAQLDCYRVFGGGGGGGGNGGGGTGGGVGGGLGLQLDPSLSKYLL
jgi:hypothetical protein